MKWYRPSEKLPKNKTFVAMLLGTPDVAAVDCRYDRVMYNSYTWYSLAFYQDGKWWSTGTPPVDYADTNFIMGWCEVSRAPEDIERRKKQEKIEEEDRVDDRFSILDL